MEIEVVFVSVWLVSQLAWVGGSVIYIRGVGRAANQKIFTVV